MSNATNPDAIILACWASADPLLRQLETDPALITLGDKPVLQRVIEKLVGIGCRRIAVVHGNHPQQAEDLLGDGERWGCSISHHYAAEGDRPLRQLAQLFPADGQNCVLAPADTVILTDLDRREIGVACTLDSGRARWSGWAVLPGQAMRRLAACARNRSELEAELELTQSRLIMTSTLSTASITATLDSLPQLFEHSGTAEGISRRPRANGIWIGKGCRIHPSARLRAPVFIGQNVLIAQDAEIGPNATIGDGCVVDVGSRIQDSVLLANTYVGRKLDANRTLLAGNTLLNSRLGVALHLPDAEFLRDTAQRPHLAPRGATAQRALAALLWLLFSPVRLALRLRDGSEADAPQAEIATPCAAAGAFQASPVRFAPTHEEIYAGDSGAWTRHFLLTFLPGLPDAASGRVALVGLEPRTAREVSSLPYYWQRLYRGAPVGLLGEAMLHGADGAATEMRYAGDAICSGPLPLRQVLKTLLRYAGRVAAEALAKNPARPDLTSKEAAQHTN